MPLPNKEGIPPIAEPTRNLVRVRLLLGSRKAGSIPLETPHPGFGGLFSNIRSSLLFVFAICYPGERNVMFL